VSDKQSKGATTPSLAKKKDFVNELLFPNTDFLVAPDPILTIKFQNFSNIGIFLFKKKKRKGVRDRENI
jgi:hypothetical protein